MKDPKSATIAYVEFFLNKPITKAIRAIVADNKLNNPKR
jgi:hypothetical protein